MTSCTAELLSAIQSSREELVRSATDMAFGQGDTPIPRNDIEQMLRAVVAVVEEALRGEVTETREAFLDTMPEIARTATWDLTLQSGLPCWVVIATKLVRLCSEKHRDEATVRLAAITGEWWRDVSRAMLPVYKAEGTL